MDLSFLQENKSILKSLVLSCPNGMTIDRLNRDYKETVGCWIPYQKLGFPSLEIFLKSIPDTLVVLGHGQEAKIGFVSNNKLQHINEMVNRQKNTTRDRKSAVINKTMRHKNGLNNFPGGPSSTHQITFNTENELDNRPSYNTQKSITGNYFDRSFAKLQKKNDQACSTNNLIETNVKSVSQSTCLHIDQKTRFTRTGNNAVPENAVNITEKKFDYNNLKRNDNRKSNMDLKNTATKQNMNKDHSTSLGGFYRSCNSKESENKTYCHKDLIKNRPAKPLIAAVLKERTLDAPISDSVKYSDQAFNNKTVKCNDNENTTKLETTTDFNDFDEAVPEFAATKSVFQLDYPEFTVPIGKKIPDYVPFEELTKGAVIGIFVSEIHSPFKFWFHIHKVNHELDILMNRLELFYRNLDIHDLVIPKSCLAPEQICAALFNDMWHRAEILTSERNNKVKVHFVDYGTVSEINSENVKYLPAIFANTPVQAIRGCLSHIKPTLSQWTKNSIMEFLSMVSDVLLYAQIVDINKKDKTVYMVLCDTNGEKTIQINRELVDRGFAKLDSEWDENKIAKVTGHAL